MKTNYFKLLTSVCLLSIHLLNPTTVLARSGGSMDGGGGDANEERVDEIRADILKWINKGGAKNLKLTSITYDKYLEEMTEILEPQKVIVGFVELDDPNNEELQVTVSGSPKTCRGFYSKLDNQPHILCNISRFSTLNGPQQYKLIHHEYAGLVGVEKNFGAASDYNVSSQITEYLEYQQVLKLAVKTEEKTIYSSTAKFNPGNTFGPVPFAILQQKTNCEMPSEPLDCTLPSEKDVQEEIDLFVKNMPQRLKAIKKGNAYIMAMAEKVKELAGSNTALNSYRFYTESAAKLESLTENNPETKEALVLFDSERTKIPADLEKLKTLIKNYQSKIDLADDEEIKQFLKIAKNQAVMNALNDLRSKNNYHRIISTFFTDERMPVYSSPFNDDNKRFDMSSYVKGCGPSNNSLKKVATLRSIQDITESMGRHDPLTLIDDHDVIKKMLDTTPAFNFKCKKVIFKSENKLENTYDAKTNTFTIEYKRYGSMFNETITVDSLHNEHLEKALRRLLK